MLMQTATEIGLYLLAAGFAWLIVHYTAAPSSARGPTEEDWRGLEKSHAFLRFSARHTRLFRILAVVTITACFWSAMWGMAWPVPVGLSLPGIVFLVAGISWTYHRDFAKKPR